MSNKIRRPRPQIQTGKEPCIRCGQPLTNEFRQQPWCLECGIELSQMEFTGEDLLETVLSVMPPQNIRMVSVAQMHDICKRMLIHKGVFDADDNQPGNDSNNKSPILVG